MGLKEQIRGDMKKAAKERNSLALSALRMTLAAIKNKEIEARGERRGGDPPVRGPSLRKALSDAEVESLVREAIGATGAKPPADIGRVMKELMPKVAGGGDGKAGHRGAGRV